MNQQTKRNLERAAVMRENEPQRPSSGPARISPRSFMERLVSLSGNTPGRTIMAGIIRGGRS